MDPPSSLEPTPRRYVTHEGCVTPTKMPYFFPNLKMFLKKALAERA